MTATEAFSKLTEEQKDVGFATVLLMVGPPATRAYDAVGWNEWRGRYYEACVKVFGEALSAGVFTAWYTSKLVLWQSNI